MGNFFIPESPPTLYSLLSSPTANKYKKGRHIGRITDFIFTFAEVWVLLYMGITLTDRNHKIRHRNMKKIILAIMLLIPSLAMTAQNNKSNESHYLAGAVPVVNGYVQFSKTYEVPGKSKSEILESLKNYIQESVVEGPNHLPQARITEVTPDSGIIAASIDEYLYFKRTNWNTHRVHFFYQLVYQVKDGSYTVTMRNLHYKYDPEANPDNASIDYRAENWITDQEALTKDGKKLARVSGKFRKHTIDRKDEIFRESAKAAGAKFKTKTVVVEEED